MTEPKAWHCPNCNAYHAPHVETCPKPKADAFPLEGYQQRQANFAATGQNWEALWNAQQASNAGLTYAELGIGAVT